MFAKLLSPQVLSPDSLDDYLAKGWFRMGQSIFTTHFLCFKHQFYSALWHRIDLTNPSNDTNFQKLQKLNKNLRVEFREADISEEKEALFTRYRESIAFDTSESIQHLLNRYLTANIFHTMEVALYDQDKLVAFGFFDLGTHSAAGITSVYDPDYRKFSLGKYLIYLKLEYCKNRQLQYFYPGYFAPGYPAFDYKLQIHAKQLFYYDLVTQNWQALSSFSELQAPLKRMIEKLELLRSEMAGSSISCELLYYDFFDANLIPNLKGFELFDFPLFLYCKMTESPVQPIVIFDIRDDHYHLLQCHRVWTPEEVNTLPDHYNTHLLKLRNDLYQTKHAEEIKAVLLSVLKDEVES